MALTGCPIEEEKEKLPPIEKVWIVGDTYGWPPTNDAVELTKGANGNFSWSGALSGYMKFVGNSVPNHDQEGVWLTPTGKNNVPLNFDADTALKTVAFGIYLNKQNKDKGAWQITSPGIYEITVNVKTLKVTFELKEGNVVLPIEPDPVNFDAWLVGASTASGSYNGWAMPSNGDGGNPNKMAKTSPGVFTWEDNLAAALEGVSFVTNKVAIPDWSADGWFTASGDTSVPVNGVLNTAEEFSVRQNSGQTPMFQIKTAGKYAVTLNTNTMKVTFKLKEASAVQPIQPDPVNFDAWLVGASTESGSYNGWAMPSNGTDGNPNKMEKTSAGVFTWSGSLIVSAEGVSFVTNKVAAPDWGADGWFTASGDASVPVNGMGTPEEFEVQQKAGQNPMFEIRTAGNYTITLNTTTTPMKVKFVKN
jgi:hypothetical protein